MLGVAESCMRLCHRVWRLQSHQGQRLLRFKITGSTQSGSSFHRNHTALAKKTWSGTDNALRAVACPSACRRQGSTPSHRQYSTPNSARGVPPQLDIQQNEDHLSISLDNQTFRTSYLWLRDHCRCAVCYEHSCMQNFVDILSLPDDIRPKRLSTEDDTLILTWPDDHVTTFSLSWLRENAPGQASQGHRSEGSAQQPSLFLWDREGVERDAPQDVHIDVLREGEGLREVMTNLHVYGFTFVSGLAPTRESTEEAIKLISPPMATLYGDIWLYQNDGEIADTGYTSLALKNHTDHTYFNHAAGGLVLHCLHHDGEGGENTLVDGFHAAQRLGETHPEHYETLLTSPVLAHYRDSTNDFRCQHTVLRHNVLTNQIQQLRFNPHDRSDFSYLSYEDAQRFYEAYRALGSIIDSPESELKTKLQPGRMVVFDNWRMLHGRAGFTGRRVMVGCYYTHDDLQNVKRTMAGIDV